MREWRRKHLAWPDIRRRLTADAAIARASAARARAALTEWLARPLLPEHLKKAPHWHTLLRVTTISLAALLILILGSIVYFAFEIPIGGGTTSDAPGALTVEAADGAVLAIRGTAQGEQLAYDDISPNLRKAIVAVEDRRFYSHGAVDLHGMLRAILHDLRGGHAQGASTITQQLARLMLLSNERTARRKMQEALVAIWLEHHLTKQQILARYLDTAYFGAGAYGADAAAERYFGTSAREPDAGPGRDDRRPRACALANSRRSRTSTARERGPASCCMRWSRPARSPRRRATPPSPNPPCSRSRPTCPQAPAMSRMRRRPTSRRWSAAARRTSRPAQRSTSASRRRPRRRSTATSRAKARASTRRKPPWWRSARTAPSSPMVGGRDYAASTYNRATQAQRQPGSLFKLFVYLAALKAGATPSTIVDDAPVTIGSGVNAWQPHDFEDRYEGRMPLSLAFAKSVNTVAARLGQEVGIKTVIKTAHDLGVASPLPDVPSLALGTANVTLMEMTRAFATIASDEETLDPYLVQRIASHGKILFNRPPHYGEAAEPSQAKLEMRELLADVVREGTGRGAKLAVPSGGKTGTTQDFRDAWFIGSTPDVTIGVWVGNDDNSPMDGVTGGDIPVKIWRDVATAAEGTLGHKAHRKPHATASAAQASVPPARTPDLGDAITGAVTDAARGVIAGLTPHDQDTPDSDAPGSLSGTAEVVDTATLGLGGQQVRLLGVAPTGGRAARELARYLRRREVDCTPATGGSYRCSVDGDDLATTILSNGGAAATSDAPPDLAAAQETAQEQGLGLWRGRR